MKIAVIDIGTNSIHMLIVELHRHGSFEVIGREKEMVRLGDKTLEAGYLSNEVMQRGLQAIQKFHHLAKSRGVSKILAVATSAVREAKNGGRFIQKIRNTTGIKAQIISGEEEGRLIYLGVKNSMELKPGNTLIIDIGGGSVEIMVVNRQKILFLKSLKMGVARLKDLFLKKEEPKAIKKLEGYVSALLEPFMPEIKKLGFSEAIGTSGTLNNLASMAYWQKKKLSEGVFRDEILSLSALKKIDRQLRRTAADQRSQIKGLDAKRSDLILGGAAATLVLMKKLKIQSFHLCDKAIREGMVYDYIEKHYSKQNRITKIFNVRLRSVLSLAQRCDYNKRHAEQVTKLALTIFDDLETLHALSPVDRELLHYAALLHDIGYHISYEDHHRHAYYLIKNAELSGFSEEEIHIMALAVRYHRGTLSKKNQLELRTLPKSLRGRIEWLGAILRLADALDRSHFSLVEKVSAQILKNSIRLRIFSKKNFEYEYDEAQIKSDFLSMLTHKKIIVA